MNRSQISIQDSPFRLNQFEQEDNTCSICLVHDPDKPLIRISHQTNEFFHEFHQECIEQWLKLGKRECPNCKQLIRKENSSIPEELDEERQPLLRERIVQIPVPLERNLAPVEITERPSKIGCICACCFLTFATLASGLLTWATLTTPISILTNSTITFIPP